MGNKVCSECENEKHTRCESKWKCKCKCNVGKGADKLQKGLAIAGGCGVAIAGIGITVLTGGVSGVIIGGALLGAGIGSAWQGTEKAIKKKRMDRKEFAIDVGFSAVTGIATGGIGAAGETIAANFVKQGMKQGIKFGVTKLAIRAGAGAFAGAASKGVDEIKQCSTAGKYFTTSHF